MTLPDSLDKLLDIQQRIDSSKDPKIMARIQELQKEIEFLEEKACDKIEPELQEELNDTYVQFRVDVESV